MHGLKTSSGYISPKYQQVNMCIASIIQMQSLCDMFSKAVYQAFGNWLMTFGLTWASAWFQSLPPVCTHVPSIYMNWDADVKAPPLACNCAPLSKTLFPLLMSFMFSSKKRDQTMLSATALKDSLKLEVQVCLQAWGGIGAWIAKAIGGSSVCWPEPQQLLTWARLEATSVHLGCSVLMVCTPSVTGTLAWESLTYKSMSFLPPP